LPRAISVAVRLERAVVDRVGIERMTTAWLAAMTDG
jgi:hypothetical protein